MPVYYYLYFYCNKAIICKLFCIRRKSFNPLGYKLQRRHNNKGSSFDLENC